MFNEDSRVKIPTLLHLTRLGYQYISLKNNKSYDPNTNIFTHIFDTAIQEINSGIEIDTVKRLYEEITLDLENEDLGKAFFEKLTNRSGIKLIDFENLACFIRLQTYFTLFIFLLTDLSCLNTKVSIY